MTDSTSSQTIVQILALCQFSGVHPRLMEVLIRQYGDIEHIFKADAGSLMSIGGMTADTANRVANANTQLDRAEEYYSSLRQRDISVVSRFEPSYPHRLFELNDPPTLIFYRGVLPDDSVKMVALAGAEKASNEGIELTVEAARRFAEAGVQVVSSLNRGIDSSALLGSKSGEGTSFSVLSSGLDNIYPEDSRPLAIDVAKGGGLLSEYPPEQDFSPDNYRSSNRIIAALAQAVVITEFYSNSAVTLDLLKCCSQIGKLAFIMIDPRHGALTDKDGFDSAVTCGAIPMVGFDRIDDIIQALV
ncbi:MAG: DNA-processing protein DprA [Candidatus Zixiibacteriota bacterium]|nr:MAG: DNA-processing protein DprA [candidate division Zixibacteria bacterium]